LPDKNKYAQMSNRKLLGECLENMESEAWLEFVRRFLPVISGAIAEVARQYNHYSEDIVKEVTGSVYLKLCSNQFACLRNLRLEHENSLFRYLKLVAFSVAHDFIKKFLPALDADEPKADLIRPGQPGSVEQIERTITLNEIQRAVEKATSGRNAERDRAIFWLHYRQGFPTSAIAQLPWVNLTSKGVESVISRISIEVRNALTSDKKTSNNKIKAFSARV
jgi:RNA polymerase sigma-70 factor (ECF subfamily)